VAPISNEEVAATLERVGDLLEAQGANPFRVRAYHGAAGTLRELERPVAEVLDDGGVKALADLPGIGESLASAIQEVVRTGRLGLLERLEGEVSPEDLFTTLPGIGEELARRIHRDLDVDTLEELELAAHDGRLEGVPGFGPRRARAVRDTLDSLLRRSTRRRARRIRARETGRDPGPPPVSLLLEVDREYRERSEQGELPTIAPRRFNPQGRAWLPILHTDRDPWHFTALFSNTARAHELGRTRDWVVLYFEWNGHEDQCTVVTERQGEGVGRRVVRGREGECALHYRRLTEGGWADDVEGRSGVGEEP
jgi:DNA polymerase (family X)